MTLAVLALDALDAALVNQFDIEAYDVGAASNIETFSHSRDQPFTPEVWATVATGLEPEAHGVTGSGTSEWGNSALELGSRFSAFLPEHWRGRLGRVVRSTTGVSEQVGRTTADTIFDYDDAVVRNWPGVTDGSDLQRAWRLMHATSQSLGKREFERELLGLAAEQFGWLREMLNHDLSVVGTHVHALDAAGHAYCDDEPALRHVYERIGEYVSELESALGPDDELLLLSDHGMNVSFYDLESGRSPGDHSWRAYVSATINPLPDSVYDVYEWVDTHRIPSRGDEEAVDIPTEQLRELGYIE